MSKLNVYVAGASKNKERARKFIERVNESARMQITHDWVRDLDAAKTTDAELSDRMRWYYAVTDLDAVRRADVVVVLVEETMSSRGCWVELGYALATKSKIIVSGGSKRSIFTVQGVVDFEDATPPKAAQDLDAFAQLEVYAQAWAHGIAHL